MSIKNKVAMVVLVAGGIGLAGISLASQDRTPPAMGDGSVSRRADDGGSKVRSASSKVRGPILARSKPVRLVIPSIDVDSVIQYVGQEADGSLEVPAPGPHYNEAAWYRYSPTPGSLGPAILLGHVDSASDGPSVFFRLGELEKDDRISIERADGSIAVFEVDKVSRYAKDDFPTKTVYGNIDHAGLRILTCGGTFDEGTGHYLDNVVVFASLLESRHTRS